MTLESIKKREDLIRKNPFKGKEMEHGTLTEDFNYKPSQFFTSNRAPVD